MANTITPHRSRRPSVRFRCASCADVHEGLPALGYALPDVLSAMPPEERMRRATISPDLCILDDDHYFVRAMLRVPLIGFDETFEYGPWVEVAPWHFARYAVTFNVGATPAWSQTEGRIANAFPVTQPSSLGVECRLVLSSAQGERPEVHVTDRSHPLFAEQQSGIPFDRVCQLVSRLKVLMLVADRA